MAQNLSAVPGWPPNIQIPSTVPGYPKLAERMAHISGAALFRRFTETTVEDLLYRQAELVFLSNELRIQQQKDHYDTDIEEQNNLYSTDWEALLKHKEGGSGKQMELILDIRAKLGEYRV
jgi:hypothetical protein